MSTNCIICVKNKRTGGDLLCNDCRAKKRPQVSRQVSVFVGEDGLVGLLCGEGDNQCDVAYFSHPDGGAFEKTNGENDYDPADVAHTFAKAWNATYAAGVNPEAIAELRDALQDALDNCLWRSESPIPLSEEESNRIFFRAKAALENLKLQSA